METTGFEVFVLRSSGLLLKKLLLVTHSHLLKKKKSFKSGRSANTVKCCGLLLKGNFSRQKLALGRETIHFAANMHPQQVSVSGAAITPSALSIPKRN